MADREEDLGAYEMQWDCAYCGAKKLLGKTHRHCPECGAAQDGKRRYFPAPGEEIAVADHVYCGADRQCPYCQSPQSARAKHCARCGGALDGAAEVARVMDSGAAPPPAPAPVKSGGGRGKWIALAVAVAVVAVVVALTWKRSAGFTVTGHAWEREIAVESFAPRSLSEWCDELPADARLVRRSREVRSHTRVADGEECSVQRVDRGDGTFAKKKVCTTKYREDPVYADKCAFTADRWGPSRSLKASGVRLDEVRWPSDRLRLGRCVGCEREGARKERYELVLAAASGETKRCDVDEARWRAAADGSRWSVPVKVLTGGLDCAAMTPAR